MKGMIDFMEKMSVKDYTHILSAASGEEVEKISALVKDGYEIKVVKEPQKTLAMIKVREPVAASLFYLGEALCTESMVELDGVKGFCVVMGDDFEKAVNCAVIDAAINANVKELDEIFTELSKLGEAQKSLRRKLNGEIMKSRVNFSTMGG